MIGKFLTRMRVCAEPTIIQEQGKASTLDLLNIDTPQY